MGNIKRRFFNAAGVAALFTPAAPAIIKPSMAQEVEAPPKVHLDWTSGGEDASAWTPHGALTLFDKEMGIPRDVLNFFGDRVDGNRYALDPIGVGEYFDIMCFGGVKPGSDLKWKKGVAANPPRWRGVPDNLKQMKSWTYRSKLTGVTYSFFTPLVCGNCSIRRWRRGQPGCIPIPSGTVTI